MTLSLPFSAFLKRVYVPLDDGNFRCYTSTKEISASETYMATAAAAAAMLMQMCIKLVACISSSFLPFAFDRCRRFSFDVCDSVTDLHGNAITRVESVCIATLQNG